MHVKTYLLMKPLKVRFARARVQIQEFSFSFFSKSANIADIEIVQKLIKCSCLKLFSCTSDDRRKRIQFGPVNWIHF